MGKVVDEASVNGGGFAAIGGLSLLAAVPEFSGSDANSRTEGKRAIASIAASVAALLSEGCRCRGGLGGVPASVATETCRI